MSALEIAAEIIRELDHFQANFHPVGGANIYPAQLALLSEPFVAYAHLKKIGGPGETFLICRHYTPHKFAPADTNTTYGSYLSNHVGQLMAQRPGDAYPFDQSYTLNRKNDFRSRKRDGRWDGIGNRMAWIRGGAVATSLRRLIAGEIEEPQERRIEIKVQLPALGILDAEQDQVFRLPFHDRVRISGAPGTGKTTVLLKRLSQKTKREFLTPSERDLVPVDEWREGQNWVLFTPSDLLKAYLNEALNKELLPAGDENVKVYELFRHEILREIGFIKVAKQGYFHVAGRDAQLLRRESGSEHVQLTQQFGKHLSACWSQAYRDALQHFNNEVRTPLSLLADESQRVIRVERDAWRKVSDDASAELAVLGQPDVTDPKAHAKAVERIKAERAKTTTRATGLSKLNEDVNKLVGAIRAVTQLLDQTQNVTIRTICNQVRRLQDQLPMWTAEHFEDATFPEIPMKVGTLRDHVRSLIDELSMKRMFETIPRAFQEFREVRDTQERFFSSDAVEMIRQRYISAPEQDCLLFHALEFVRVLSDSMPPDLNGVPSNVRQVLKRMRTIVAIDEVADFSSLEIACMERLALPRCGGVTISGDLMQRVTRHGLKSWDELDALSSGFTPCELNVSYRQTARLFAVAKDLYEHVTGKSAGFRSACVERTEDPPPLAVRVNTDELAVHEWLGSRIEEICGLHEGHLPTTAVVVPHGDDVDELRRLLQSRLVPLGIQVDGSRNGDNLGNAARVRIFPVECIKGLEFEAVFYVGFDRMVDIHRELIDKYVYVGLSRARSFLGVAYERQFPQRFSCIAHHFVHRIAFQDSA